MKDKIRSLFIFPVVFFLFLSCSYKPQNIQTVRSEATNVEDPNGKRLTDRHTLNRFLPVINLFSDIEGNSVELDSLLKEWFPGKDVVLLEDGTIYIEGDLLVISNQIDGRNFFAITYSEPDSLLLFYRRQNNEWKEIGRRIPDRPIGEISFEELNAEPDVEVVISSYPNMNGNSWKECFVYFPDEDTIQYAGDFCTNYTVNLENKTMMEVYEGSWYMNPHKTLYGWHDHMLIPLRMTEIIVAQSESDIPYIEYYENPTFEKLELVFREPYDPDNAKHERYWDDF